MKKIGRPKREEDTRDARVVFYLTEEDSQKVTEYSENLGFKSRSELCTAIFERLLIGGFAPMVFAKVGMQLADRLDKRGVKRDGGLYFGLRPLPPLPDEAIPARLYKEIVKAVREELRKEEEA